MLIFGVTTLVQGKFTLSPRKVVTGVPAYLIGTVLMATLPLIVITAFTIGFVQGMQNPAAAEKGEIGGDLIFNVVDIVGIVIGLGVALTIAAIYGKDPAANTFFAQNPYVANPYTMPPPPTDPNNPYNPPMNR